MKKMPSPATKKKAAKQQQTNKVVASSTKVLDGTATSPPSSSSARRRKDKYNEEEWDTDREDDDEDEDEEDDYNDKGDDDDDEKTEEPRRVKYLKSTVVAVAPTSPTVTTSIAPSSTPTVTTTSTTAASSSGSVAIPVVHEQPAQHHRGVVFPIDTIPFYGREEELEVLEQVVNKICCDNNNNNNNNNHHHTTTDGAAPAAHVVLVSGPPGVGKTALLNEACGSIFWKTLVCRGECSTSTNNSNVRTLQLPLQPIIQILNELVHKLLVGAGGCAGAVGSSNRALWKERLQTALGGEGPFLASCLVPKLAILMDYLPGAQQQKATLKPTPPQLQQQPVPPFSPATSAKKHSPRNKSAVTNKKANNNGKKKNGEGGDDDEGGVAKKCVEGDDNDDCKVKAKSPARKKMSFTGSSPISPRKLPNNIKPPSSSTPSQQETPPLNSTTTTTWDWNTPQRFTRLTLAVRDLLQAVAEYHPLVLVIDNLHHADDDTWQMLRSLFGCVSISSTPSRLTNVLLVGLYDTDISRTQQESSDKADGGDVVDAETFEAIPRNIAEFEHDLQQLPQQDPSVSDNEDDGSNNHGKPYCVLTKLSIKPFSLEEVEQILCSCFLTKEEIDYSEVVDRIQDLAEILHTWTAGNILYMVQVLRWLNDQKLLTLLPSEETWSWNRKTIKKSVKLLKDNNDKAFFGGVQGLVERRIQELPQKVQFVVLATAALHQQHSSCHTGPPASITDSQHLYRVISAGFLKGTKDRDVVCPIASLDEFNVMMLKACRMGFLKRINTIYSFAFVHDLIRDSAYGEFVSQKSRTTSHSKTVIRKDLQIHARMGTELSAMATNTIDPNAKLMKYRYNVQAREEFKFLAADQLIRSKDVMWEERGSILKLLVETGELCVAKTSFKSALNYLESGLDFMLSADPATGKREGDPWNSSEENYAILVRAHMLLVKMRLATGLIDTSKTACDKIFEHAKTLKDRVPACQLQLQILVAEENYQEAVNRVLGILGQLGESFPTGGGIPDIVGREIDNLRKIVGGTENAKLLHPPRMTDKKTIDTMLLLASLVEVCRLCNKKHIGDLAVIRMMHLSLKFGFSRQYPMAFSCFGASLIHRAISTRNAAMAKEAHRMGQVCEKIARLGDFYGGQSVTHFHWHISHWKRLYKRTLEPLLRVYNAQVDSGDLFHVNFTISTYIQYHLASGYDLTKLDDNLQLFDALHCDYQLPDDWKISLPQHAVSNLLGESTDPLLFFGDNAEDQESQIREMREAGMSDALQYMSFLRLYIAIFFHNYELADQCLAELSEEIEGIWIPWILFFQCLVEISRIPNTKSKIARKQLNNNIDETKGRLIDWYNEGAPNPSAMISLIDAELTMANKSGKKDFPALRIQNLFDEAISAAQNDELKHLEALSYERAAMHFREAQVPGFCAEYIGHAHRCYDQWNAVAKVIDIEEKFGKYLKIARRTERPAAAYIQHNQTQHQYPQKTIGGGRGEIKSFNIKEAVKKVGMFGKTRGATSQIETRPAKSDKSENTKNSCDNCPPPMSPAANRRNSKPVVRNSADEAIDADFDSSQSDGRVQQEGAPSLPVSQSPTKSPGAAVKKKKKSKPLGRLFAAKKDHDAALGHSSEETEPKPDDGSGSENLKSPSGATSWKGRRFLKPKMKLPFGGGKIKNNLGKESAETGRTVNSTTEEETDDRP